MQPIGRSQRTDPTSRRGLRHRLREAVAEQCGDPIERHSAEVIAQQQRVARIRRTRRAARQPRENLPRVGFCRRAPGLADKDLSKRNQRLGAKLLGMGLEIGAQVGLLWRRHRVLEQKLHLLAQPAADDGVILVQTERERGAIQNFLADVIPDLRLQLVRGGRAMPGAREPRGQAVDIGLAHDDLPVGNAGARTRRARRSRTARRRAPGNAPAARAAASPARGGPQLFGVYQIGEV